MMYNNISYLVGSANAKLNEDIRRIQKDNKTKSKSNSRFSNYLFNCSSIRQANCESKDFKLDFEIVKISCKKEMYNNADSADPKLFKKFFFENSKLELATKILIFVLIGSVVAFSIFRVINLRTKNGKLSNHTGSEITNIGTLNQYKRSANIYSTNEAIEWSSETIPMCYELEPLTFYDSNNDGIGDLNGVILKLDYFKNVLIINCLLIKNLQSYYSFETNEFIMNQTYDIDEKLGKLTDLVNLIDSAHKMQIRVLLEIDITGTSVYHEMFLSNQKNVYLSSNQSNSNEIKRKDFAYFNYDSLIAQQKIIDIFKFWFELNADGFLLKNFEQIKYKNTTSLEIFIEKINSIRRMATIPIFTLIGTFTPEDLLINRLFNIYLVELDMQRFKEEIESGSSEIIDLVQFHLSNEKKIIWSLKNLHSNNESNEKFFKEFYFFAYSLPGITLLQQGEELESELSNQRLEMVSLNHQSVNRSFSNLTSINFKGLPVLNIGLESNLNKEHSFVDFIKYFNSRVKTKLNDMKPIKRISTHAPQIPKRPQPFKQSSYESLSSSYLLSNYYNITNWNSVLKVTRQIHNRKAENSLKFYRNIVFMFNYSKYNISIDNLITLPILKTKKNPKMSIHVIYDSTKSLPEHIELDSQNKFGFYSLYSNHYMAVEF